MKKIIAFGASSSSSSINKQLAEYAANKLENVSIEILDLNDFEMPIYSMDKEKSNGIPEETMTFKAKLDNADGLIISFAEHNGVFSAAYKNIYDWASRIGQGVFGEKPMLLMATSPGKRGGIGVLELAEKVYSYSNPNIVGAFSLPSFNDNFTKERGIIDESLETKLLTLVRELQEKI